MSFFKSWVGEYFDQWKILLEFMQAFTLFIGKFQWSWVTFQLECQFLSSHEHLFGLLLDSLSIQFEHNPLLGPQGVRNIKISCQVPQILEGFEILLGVS